jgi:hypothetical protein
MRYSSETMPNPMEALIDYAFRNKGKVFFCTKGKELVAVSMFDAYNTYNIHYGATNVTECYSYVIERFTASHVNVIVDDDGYVYVKIDDAIYETTKEKLPTYNVKFTYFAQAQSINGISYFATQCDANELVINTADDVISFIANDCTGRVKLHDVKREEATPIHRYNPAIIFDATYISFNDRYSLALSKGGLLKLENDYKIYIAPLTGD